MLPLVNVCIPGYNLGEQSLPLLERCLQSVLKQSYPNIRVIISDHSEDRDIDDYLQSNWFTDDLDIVYTRFDKGRGTGVPNMNNAFDLAPEDSFIKPLNQDDFLKTPVTITRMVDAMQQYNTPWCVVGCNHVNDEGMDINYNHHPSWVTGFELAYGMNRLGSLSVVMFEQCDLRQDTNLAYLNDCEFYYRLGQKFGPPAIIKDMLVTIAMRKQGLSNTLPLDALKAEEQRYVQKKHGVT